MFVKEIIIDGFKSYAQATTVHQFDPHFNAITGLNGSGKSNILDAICFVLGISNLSQVRATNLQELIYKGGNAGITKATVSITFDNLDKASSPAGYHEYEEITITRQISVGGKHKYLINGQNATAQRVCDLFCSVQLNVNNPNFLIMQGKITKVLNMKPIEILSMIEEAAGTKTYDTKKANALLTIDKKNSKLNEIERVLREDITPMIVKLKQERSAYIEYQKCEREYLHLHKISTAFRYFQHQEGLVKIQAESNDLELALDKNNSRVDEIDKSVEKLREDIGELKKALGEKDDLLIEYEAKLKEIQLEITKLNSDKTNFQQEIKSEKKRAIQIEKSVNENNNLIKTKENKLLEMKNFSDTTKAEYEKAEQELRNAEKNYEALCCGFAIDGEENLGSIQDQLITLSNQISQINSQIKQAHIKMKNATDEVKKLDKELAKSSDESKDLQKDFDSKQLAFEKTRDEVAKLNYDPNNFEELMVKRRDTKSNYNHCEDRCQNFYQRYPYTNFEYKVNRPDFDKSKVKGLVCNLFRVKDPRFATALETTAGGKLFNVVVDTDSTGKILLESGSLKRKVTIIPMNKIKAYVINDRTLKIARQIVGEDMVHSALNLIEYDPVYKPVMEYVFGSKLICTSLQAAKQVAFTKEISTNAVTLEGDHFDPEGILSGGSKAERGNILIRLSEFKEDRDELEQLGNELRQLDMTVTNEKQKMNQFNQMKRILDENLSRMNSAKALLENTTYHQKLEKKESLDSEIVKKKEDVENMEKELISIKEKHAELTLKSQNNNKEDEKKKEEKIIETKKLFIEKHQKSITKFQKEYDSITLELQVLNTEITGYEEELVKINETLEGLNSQSNESVKKITELKENEKEVQDNIDGRKELIREKSANISRLSSECDKMEKEKNSIELKKKEINHKKSNLSEQLSQSTIQLERLIESHEWIKDEKEMFGQINTVYDFNKHNMKEVNHRLNDIKNRKEKLSKQVDMRAMGMLAKKEEEYEELNNKRKIVLGDKTMLESTIEDLEKVKMEILNSAFEKINVDFGNIFKTLLPGAFARLEAVSKQTLLEGVEFKVAFGDVWKESLTELSGGQRSLVALSLILSLLLYKPAPLYILDEVDAALDTSHTQNIGLMIKKYFKHSQFVIVSLKDGMFNNANVLFRTKLIDGVSTLQRYEQKRKVTDSRSSNARQV